ncbi:hypothetical protein PMW_200 [Pseudomonas phage phiPMW]|uniref:Uncharacterized protein n=1 Tax=Pseudomonas phage phiPMW TaxID=1815582 RepID=A0A1S5R1P6_9CAUD|nr:hypothetical protein FDG97_gp150 [Pseudomonas phage phiPMW]ANA49325.1 hypothetical protein PMW_200 [Pseudomonas phage phiPMW]
MSIFMDTKYVDCTMTDGDFIKVNATNQGSLKKVYVSCINRENEYQQQSESDVSLSIEETEELIAHLKEAVAFVKGEKQ